MINFRLLSYAFCAILFFSSTGCGTDSDRPADASNEETASAEDGSSSAELDRGFGPIENVNLGEIDPDLVSEGEEIFNTKCVACHRFEERYVGPALGDILERRTPEFIMNMMLNPQEMVEKHPEVKAMLAQFLTPMPNQNLTEEDARAILEYIRQETQQPEG